MNDLSKEKIVLFEEKFLLKKEVEKFSNIAYKLTNGKENLEKLLGSQRQSLSKHGLGYNYFTPKKSSKIAFVKQRNFVDNACSYCGVYRHFAYSCNLRQPRKVGTKNIWVSKGTIQPNIVFGYQF